MTQTYAANGKLLLTGEYLVLHGALALALPLKLGQSMSVERLPHQTSLQWDAFDPKGHWFSASLHPETFEVLHSDDFVKAEKLSAILKAVYELNPHVFTQGLHFTTRLGFDTKWGLGSSSTLLSNLGQWAEVDPYTLLKNTIGGSGYDIACATATSPIFYRLELDTPVTQPACFMPPFAQQLFFVYLGKKQHSSKEVASFNERWQHLDGQGDIEAVSTISRSLPRVQSLDEFCAVMDRHEDILSRCLDRPPVKTLFPDFEGSLKSLGAWGGDFILAATPWTDDKVRCYFRQKGMDVVFNYNDIVYHHNKAISNGTKLDQ